jgi:hypothetical protein
MPIDRLSSFIRNRWEYLLPLSACLLAFLLRYHFLVTYRYPMMIHEQDAVGYMEKATSLLQLRLPSVTGRPPGYPLIIAVFSLLPVDLEYAARLASIFMDALIVLPLYVIARIYLSRAASLAVCLLWATFSFSLYFSTSPLSQSSYLCYILIGIALLHRGLETSGKGWLIGAGMMFALSFLARPEGIVGFGCGFLICLTQLFGKDRVDRRNFLVPACFLLGFLLLAGPFLVALRAALGYWSVSAGTAAHVKTADVLMTLDARGELQKTGRGLSVWKEYYGTLPVFLGAVWENIRAFSGVYRKTFPLWMHLASGAGVIVLAWRNRWRDLALLLILLAVTAPNFVVNIPKTHSYLYPVFALTFICFAACFDAVARGVCRAAGKSLPVVKPRLLEVSLWGGLLLCVTFIGVTFYRDADAAYQSPGLVREALMTEKIYKDAGEIIKNNSQNNDVIMTRWGLVGYFADRPVITLPKGGVKEVVDYGRKIGARFLLIDTNSVLSRRQELLELLGPLEGKPVNPAYGIEMFTGNYFPEVGGYVIYRYPRNGNGS